MSRLLSDYRREYAAAVIEFLEVAVHAVLCFRGVYPAELFEARQKYGLAVQMCRHPALSTWIRHDALEAMRPLLEKDDVRKVDVVISDREAVPVERFAFSLEDCGQGQAQAQARAGGIAVPYTIDPAELRKALRNLLTRLNYADSLMDALPDGCTFNILVFQRSADEHLPALLQDKWTEAADSERAFNARPYLFPMGAKSVIGGTILNIYAEENKERKTAAGKPPLST